MAASSSSVGGGGWRRHQWASHGAAAAAGGAAVALALRVFRHRPDSSSSSSYPSDLPLRPKAEPLLVLEPLPLEQPAAMTAGPPPPLPPPPQAPPRAAAPPATAATQAVTREALGRATWTLLHTLAARFPDRPTRRQRRDAESLIDALTRVYPCGECAAHFAELCARDPPDASSAAALREWTCRAHNAVNARLGKPRFDCALAAARWSPQACDGVGGGEKREEDACAMGVGASAAAVGAAAAADAIARQRRGGVGNGGGGGGTRARW